ncbi:cytochrome c biosynthesis protein [Nocardioides flavus (ex Wang et al. 2016)]|uniref:Cytochrome c biosynthesis protein n=1 Tax=Nocardioides flavus (ex Wang et al. 2016) TaxID=2058780 RepID=A0ABQ3HIR1_9ACTN|nr:cytochrome c biogenesis protein ResB [Nocardioides flavus (ex Wang et al. 2016)]GHE16554.1 cytochrome c biosynthesis protein [Nocardioides flavus (ex Wang et al. 2016)]
MTDLKPDLQQRPSHDRQATALPTDLTARELGRWTWRQLTSMRTALVLLLLLALASIPGSVIPQENIDSLAVSQWRDNHPQLAPIWDRLDLFNVYGSVWFSSIYILLMISLVGCIVPRLFVYARALRARPPRAPRHLTRLPESASYATDESPEAVLERAATALRGRRFRVDAGADAVAAERGYLREAGNLLFHLAVIVVLVGVAVGSLFGYKGGVIMLNGDDYGFSNNLTQYDDFAPGALFDPDVMEPFSFSITDFQVDWLTEGRRAGMAREFVAELDYAIEPGGETRSYDLRVNHPLSIGGTDVFLIGHGYAPVITIRDGDGEVAYSGPSVFLPTNAQTFESFGVIKAPDARPDQIGLEGTFYPTFAMGRDTEGNLTMPASVFGDAIDPLVSLFVYTGDLGLDDGTPASVYVLDKAKATQVVKDDGQPFRMDLRPGDTVTLPDDLGTVSFDGLQRWNKIQVSRSPGKMVALAGVVLALIGLLGSLFIRPRRMWVRARRQDDGTTLVEVARLDRSSAGDPEDGAAELAEVVAALQGETPETKNSKREEDES